MILKLFFIIFTIVLGGSTVSGIREAARLCVTQQIELDKCNDIKNALNENLLLNRLDCTLEKDYNGCIQKIKNNEADIIVMDSKLQHLAFDKGLRILLWENYRNDDVIVALANENFNITNIKSAKLDFDIRDLRLVHSALLFNKIIFGKITCEVNKRNQLNENSIINDNSISFIRAKDLKYNNLINKKLICQDLTMHYKSDYLMCNFETGAINAILSHDMDFKRRGELVGILNEIVGYFGPHGYLRKSIKLFGTYKGEYDVIFNDDTQFFSVARNEVNGVDEVFINKLLCDGNIVEI